MPGRRTKVTQSCTRAGQNRFGTIIFTQANTKVLKFDWTDACRRLKPLCACCDFTFCVRDGVGMPGVLVAVWAPALGHQLHGVGERTVADLVGRRDFHQVDVPGLQLLQQSHGVCPCGHIQTTRHGIRYRKYKEKNVLLCWRATHPPSEWSASVRLATPSGRRTGWCSASRPRWAPWAPATTPERCRPRSESLSLP